MRSPEVATIEVVIIGLEVVRNTSIRFGAVLLQKYTSCERFIADTKDREARETRKPKMRRKA